MEDLDLQSIQKTVFFVEVSGILYRVMKLNHPILCQSLLEIYDLRQACELRHGKKVPGFSLKFQFFLQNTEKTTYRTQLTSGGGGVDTSLTSGYHAQAKGFEKYLNT